jgi:hypothetical protein
MKRALLLLSALGLAFSLADSQEVLPHPQPPFNRRCIHFMTSEVLRSAFHASGIEH